MSTIFEQVDALVSYDSTVASELLDICARTKVVDHSTTKSYFKLLLLKSMSLGNDITSAHQHLVAELSAKLGLYGSNITAKERNKLLAFTKQAYYALEKYSKISGVITPVLTYEDCKKTVAKIARVRNEDPWSAYEKSLKTFEKHLSKLLKEQPEKSSDVMADLSHLTTQVTEVM